MKQYICVFWLHDDPDFPLELWSELDDDHWETRKVEIWRDGTIGFACKDEETSNTRLGDQPVPSLDEIERNPEFRLERINKEQFESVWAKRLQPVAASR